MAATDSDNSSNNALSASAFKCATVVVLLMLTIASSLAPLWISQHGTSAWRNVLTRKLQFVTAGVFIGSGLLHLLPDAVKLYDELLRSMDAPAPWMHEFPVVYLLAALGCMVVWSVDLLTLGDSAKMMAVATAARPDHETSICRVQIPAVTSFGLRDRSVSADGWTRHMTGQRRELAHVGCCTCGTVAVRAASPFQRATKIEETTCLLTEKGITLVGEASVRTFSYDHTSDCTSGESELETAAAVHPHATRSDHVVFSGESSLLPYILAALFSVHSLIAGFALGVNPSLDRTAIATTVAIFSHKFIEAMAVGANFARAKESIEPTRSVAVLTLYSCMTPLGVLLGMALAATLQGPRAHLVESAALGIASGSFLYLAFHELSEEEEQQHAGDATSARSKVVLFASGLGTMAALAVFA